MEVEEEAIQAGGWLGWQADGQSEREGERKEEAREAEREVIDSWNRVKNLRTTTSITGRKKGAEALFPSPLLPLSMRVLWCVYEGWRRA